MALRSNADLRLLSGLLPASPVFDLPIQLLILHLLTSVSAKFHRLFFFFFVLSLDFSEDYCYVLDLLFFYYHDQSSSTDLF